MRTAKRAFTVLLLTGALAAPACSDDDGDDKPADAAMTAGDGSTGGGDAKGSDGAATADSAAPKPDGGSATDAAAGGGDAKSGDGGGTTGGDGGADGGLVLTEKAKRGQYLANSVLGCSGCHTPSGAGGAPDTTKLFAGRKCFVDTMPMVDGMGCLNSANLTPHESGLKSRTADQIKDLIRKGERPDGKFLFSNMPYYNFHNLTDDDADAIVEYLRALPPVDNMLPANEPPFATRPMKAEVPPIDLNEVPNAATNADDKNVKNGRYLAAMACVECHSPDLTGGTRSFDVSKAFQGGHAYTVMGKMVYAANLTPDDTGLKGWTEADIVKVLKMGKDKNGAGVCSPMRSYANMTDQDATDIAKFLLALAPKMNMIPMQCTQ